MTTEPTTTFGNASLGAADDEVVQFREWGTDNVHLLPEPSTTHWASIGADASCSVHLIDKWRRVSRVHAELVHSHGHWLLRDLASTYGTWLFGVRTPEVWLAPGDEIAIGYMMLVAESRRSIEVRRYLRRLLGWGQSHLEAVDLALRSIRAATTGRGALVLCGEDDLVPVARSLHRRTLGIDRPFAICDPAGYQVNDSTTLPENYGYGRRALDAAAGGTLCVRHECLPHDFSQILGMLKKPATQVQLIVTARLTSYCAPYLSSPVSIPPLGGRIHELRRIIDEYVQDAFQEFNVERRSLRPEDYEWILRHASSSFAAIEKATLRLAAIRISKNVIDAADLLQITSASLMQWIERRKVPTSKACSCCSPA